MIARSAKIITEVIIGLIAVVALGAGLAIWRLSSGPLSVDFITPYLEESFADNERGLTLDVGETVLAWGGHGRLICAPATCEFSIPMAPPLPPYPRFRSR